MRDAEEKMRKSLKSVSLAELAGEIGTTVPMTFIKDKNAWFAERQSSRRESKSS